MKRILLQLSILSLFVASIGCATTSPYTGPVADEPSVSISYLRHFEQDDPRLPSRVETIGTAAITNPSNSRMTIVLDCDRTFTTLTIAPRTTEHVLLDPLDASCTVTQ